MRALAPAVFAGEYETVLLGVFTEPRDAELFANRYNLERGYGLHDSSRAYVDAAPVYSPGDAGSDGHTIRHWRMGNAWRWDCTCSEWGHSGSEQCARESAARHLEHWGATAPQATAAAVRP